ncbi:MAG: hypothetical protein NW241_00940 [Bacteroidia bacterium]|nr:hypothetical protein [Bacteroidia bacterium]
MERQRPADRTAQPAAVQLQPASPDAAPGLVPPVFRLAAGVQPVQMRQAPAIIQRRRAPTANSRAAAVTVPAVRDLSRIPDVVARNQAINQSYHEFDTAMTQYLGQPLISNWMTFGQHASREAGTQIRNLDEGLAALRLALASLQSFATLAAGTPSLTGLAPGVEAMRILISLLAQEGLVKQSMLLAFAQAGITQADLNDIIQRYNDLLSPGSLLPPVLIYRLGRLAVDLAALAVRLTAAIPGIIAAVIRIRDNMVSGNRQIYENIAPAYHRFLSAANAHAAGAPFDLSFAGDPSGFVAAAFNLYIESKLLADEYAATPDRTLLDERRQKAHRANLLIGFQEQLVILQPIFDTMQAELRAMSGTMLLHDPNGAHPLIGNWGNFYTRMGIDASAAPADPRSIRPDTLPPMLRPGAPGYSGTIGEYFEQNLENARVHRAPPAISRF